VAPGTELLSFIPRFGDQPAYRIFECSACKALTWGAEAVGNDLPSAQIFVLFSGWRGPQRARRQFVRGDRTHISVVR